MAGDWVKIRDDLPDDPAVIAIAKTLNLEIDTVLGKLLRFWIWCDRQLVTGNASSVTRSWIDDALSATGFARALEKVGWLTPEGDGFSIPNFDRHMGASTKKRALQALRQEKYRQKDDKKRDAVSVTKISRTRRDDARAPLLVSSVSSTKKEVAIPSVLDTEKFRDAWARWRQHLTEKRKKPTPSAVKSQLKKLEDMGHDRAVVAIEHSIAGSYQGLYEPGGSQSSGTRQGPRRKSAKDRGEYDESVDVSDCTITPDGGS